MLIPEHKIDEVRERVDLVALISRHVELKKAGRSYKGCCPFHQEKTPSFHVTPEMGRFKCFGCGVGGDAISFVQRYLGKTFVDAVKDLAREVGVELTGAEDPTAREKQQLKDVTDLADAHFRARLADSKEGKLARDYLVSRGVSDAMIAAFGLGWAPAAWSELSELLQARGVLEWAVGAGLCQKRTRTDGHYDLFRGRLIVPIRSPEGRVIAFGGRLLVGEEGPKYLNSRESRLYNKSETLYGLDQAREEIRRKKSAILVEGYFDCIGLHQVGVKNTVALCSTALTGGHLALLSRHDAKDLVLLLDGDEAGRKAIERLAGALLAHGAAAQIAVLPEGEDPDTFARKHGEAGVRALIDKAQPLSAHLFATLLPDGKEASFEAKMKALDRLKPIAAQLPVGLPRSAFFGALAGYSGLPAAELESALKGKAPTTQPAPKPAPRADPAPQRSGSPAGSNGQAPAAPQDRPPDQLEAMFVACVLVDRALLAREESQVSDELAHPGLRAVMAQAATGRSAEDALYDASPQVKAALIHARGQLPQDDLVTYFGRVASKLQLRKIDDRLAFIARATRQTEGANDLSEDARRLLSERIDLLSLRKRVLGAAKVVTREQMPR